MRDLYKQLAGWSSGTIDGHAASQIAKKIWALYEAEDYLSERGQLAADVAHVAAAHGEWAGCLPSMYNH